MDTIGSLIILGLIALSILGIFAAIGVTLWKSCLFAMGQFGYFMRRKAQEEGEWRE